VQHQRQRDGGQRRDAEVRAELDVAQDRPHAAGEAAVEQREVGAGEGHEHDRHPHERRRAEHLEAAAVGREAAGRHGRERVGHRVVLALMPASA
jgi:hypothetical protein